MAATPDNDRFVSRGRFNKAHILARWCRDNGYTAVEVSEWGDVQWEMATDDINANPIPGQNRINYPSETTRGMTVGFLTETLTVKDTRR